MDPVTLGMAKAATRKTVEMAPALAKMYRKLALAGSSDANILVVGDSTGNAQNEWAFYLAQKFAAHFPNHTVVWALWADSTKNFPAGDRVTVQTGTNGKTITFWNVSVSGEIVGYAAANHGTIRSGLSAGGALPPDVVIFNYGHNSPQLDAAYRAVQIESINVYTGYYPSAAIVQIAQNPRAGGDASFANGQNKAAQVAALAFDEGHVLIDVNSDFIARSDYATAYLDPDGLHPNPAGSLRWATVAWEQLQPRARVTFASRQPREDHQWIPATSFYISQGTPELAMRGVLPGWSLDPAAPEAVVTSMSYPGDWTAVNVIALFGSSGTPGVAVCRC
ncbi:SGNH/GDSL hydrolase family protein [Rhodococcus cercidiphylli]|uniref:SGNH/GDSL hydrolase family protein n=1 Tax=Rhodococcus cercidiphylli TaxID=489916 RepID=A0ABU4B3V5_9NOCA|nr:SGNH/GDSL hydrolase family protein [Rhodococcus cercidiphylli]MDV6233164.1 SGNH/GDSL hydrolase family protein [Rhodococcus cercidiphylli]